MADEQQLNSLSRFRKQPGRLVLEEHGHCEVPAGGGVVLRRRNPLTAIPVTVHLYTPVPPAGCWIDGDELQSTLLDLAPGQHILALTLENVPLSGGLLMFAASHDPKGYQQTLPAGLTEESWVVKSLADGSWGFMLDRPEGDAWKTLTFDDGGWGPLVEKPTPVLSFQDHGMYACSMCSDQKADCLGVPDARPGEKDLPWWRKLLRQRKDAASLGTGSVWIRKEFTVPAPQLR